MGGGAGASHFCGDLAAGIPGGHESVAVVESVVDAAAANYQRRRFCPFLHASPLGWLGEGGWLFETPEGAKTIAFNTVVLALGGGVGGGWAQPPSGLTSLPARCWHHPLQPSNCGFDVAKPWSEHFRSRYAGHPLKSVALKVCVPNGEGTLAVFARKGECVATDTGIEGSLVYAASAVLREAINALGKVEATFDLLPDHSPDRVLREVAHPRGSGL